MVTAPPVIVGGSFTSATVTTTRIVSFKSGFSVSTMVTKSWNVAGASHRVESASKFNCEEVATVIAPVAGSSANALPVLPEAMVKVSGFAPCAVRGVTVPTGVLFALFSAMVKRSGITPFATVPVMRYAPRQS